MPSIDLMALACAGVMTAAFGLARFSEAAFVLPSLAVIGAAMVLAVSSEGALAESVLLVGGLGLYFLGLAIVRVMVHRSVSLRMLAQLDRGAGDENAEDIRSRLQDLEVYRLAARRDGAYRLTVLGRRVADAVAVLYRVTRLEA